MTTATDNLRRELVAAHDHVLGGPGPSEPTGRARPLLAELDALTLEDAYALQRDTVAALCDTWGAVPAGFKISITARADQERMCAAEPAFGRLTDRHLLNTGASVELLRANGPLLEPELAMRTRVDLDGSTEIDDLYAAVEVAPALEMPISRFSDWWPEGQPPRLTLPSMIADNAMAGYLVVGDNWTSLPHSAFAEVSAQVVTPSGDILRGHASNVVGGPLHMLAWLVEALDRRGESLPAGSVVSTGTFTPPIRVRPGNYDANFDHGIGSAAVTFLS